MLYCKRLKTLRVSKKHTQSEIAKLLNTTQQQYSMYEKGYRDLPSELLITLADFYNVSTDYILGRTDNPKISK